jgi:hypothetical protein
MFFALLKLGCITGEFLDAALLEHLRGVFLVSVILRCAALTASECVFGEFLEATSFSLLY